MKGNSETRKDRNWKKMFFVSNNYKIQNDQCWSMISLLFHISLCRFITNPPTSIKLQSSKFETHQTLVPTWCHFVSAVSQGEEQECDWEESTITSWIIYLFIFLIQLHYCWNYSLKHSQSHLWSANTLKNGQHACCPTCTIKGRGTEKLSKRINLQDFAAESGWQLDALSHVRDFICGNWRTEDVVVQPSCW